MLTRVTATVALSVKGRRRLGTATANLWGHDRLTSTAGWNLRGSRWGYRACRFPSTHVWCYSNSVARTELRVLVPAKPRGWSCYAGFNGLFYCTARTLRLRRLQALALPFPRSFTGLLRAQNPAPVLSFISEGTLVELTFVATPITASSFTHEGSGEIGWILRALH